MNLTEAVRNRRSIRSFSPEPVPKKIIKELISESMWSPSWGNTQPWEIVVTSGPKCEQFKKENREAFLSGVKPEPDIPMPEDWPDRHMDRYQEVGRGILTALEIERDDAVRRTEYYGTMFSLFDAPALVVITVDRKLSIEYALLDTGIFLQTFCLLAHAKDLGTCAMAASVFYPELLRKHFSITEEKRIVMGIALGFPDSGDPVNRFKRTRTDAEELITWVS